jgi:hypothetical protein
MKSWDYLKQAAELLRKAQMEALMIENNRELGLEIQNIRSQVINLKVV